MDSTLPTTSSFPSNFELALPNMDMCQVCENQAHGHHFGAFTCRACAAFFRRCHFSKEPEPQCRLNSKCKPNTARRWNCKKCRLEKCLAQGMTTQNIQYDRDAFKSSETFRNRRKMLFVMRERVPVTVEKILGEPHLVVYHKKEMLENEYVTFVDLSALIKRAWESLRSVPDSWLKMKKMSNLEQLVCGLNDYRSLQREVLYENSHITMHATFKSWEDHVCTVAKWLNYSEEIRNMPIDKKMKLLQCTWSIWNKLERVAMTAQMRVNRRCGKKQFVASHETLIDYDLMTADISWWTKYKFEELRYLFAPENVLYDKLVWEMIEVQPDAVELTYLLCNLCFGLAGRHLQGEMEVVTDRLQDILADDLHQYYVKQNKNSYTLRLKQLMKINEQFIRMRNMDKERLTVCWSLNVFRSHFSNYDFFQM